MIAAAPVVIQAPPPVPVVVPTPIASPAPGLTAGTAWHDPADPLEKFNRHMFVIHQKLDHAILRPAAMGYKQALPRPLRSGIRHFFSNLGEPVVVLNFILQVKPHSATKAAVRFLLNSTIGLAGLIDVAKSKAFELPHAPNGFGDTLGYYGVKPGPYLFLPLFGPSDFRDLLGGQADGLLLPVVVGSPFDRFDYGVAKTVLTGLDTRAELDGDLNALLGSALDPYATMRSVYLQDRAGEIAGLKGDAADTSMPGDAPDNAAHAKDATPELQDPLADPAATPSSPAASAPKASSAPELSDPLADPATAAPAAPSPPAAAPTVPARR